MRPPLLVAPLLLVLGCGPEPGAPSGPAADPKPEADPPDLQPATLGPVCAQLSADGAALQDSGDGSYAFRPEGADGAPGILLQPTDLGMVLLYDGGAYIVGERGAARRAAALRSDITEGVDTYISTGEWLLLEDADREAFWLQSRADGTWLAADGQLVATPEGAASITLTERTDCAPFPELTLDADGTPTRTTFEDGDLFGVAESHAHLMTNFSFGGGGLFHGGAYHRYGVQHALPDCDAVHGEDGRRDLFGFVYDEGGGEIDLLDLLGELAAGELDAPNHVTDGYPTFTEWPDARRRSTHQAQYHRWLERAWLGGLRVYVQHATSDETICKLTVGQGFQESRYDCTDMTAVDRIIDETWQMQRYIDALHGGEGRGWFRVVQSPAEARAVVEQGKLAVILGIETSNLFRCYLTPRAGDPTCDEAYVDAQLDAYYARGVRVLFPVHKYGNRFSPGDGHGGFIEAGDFVNSGHWTNKTEDCPPDDLSLPSMFDGGRVAFGGLNQPRDAYLSEAPNDFSGFGDDPLGTVIPHAGALASGGLSGSWCQNATLTDLGAHLLQGMMRRGMIIEVDHFPQWAYVDAYALLEENDYPAAGTHGRHWEGQIYALGGIASARWGRCHDPDVPGQSTEALRERLDLIASKGAYPGLVFGFDFNGFAGVPGPRFGDEGCGPDQPNPIAYPFDSYAGDVRFTAPAVGERAIDFNTEGMVHIGLLPELLHSFSLDAPGAPEVEALYRGAEAYIRMWEKAEARAATMGAD